MLRVDIFASAIAFPHAPVAELVDALDSKSSSFGVGVRFPPGVLKKSYEEIHGSFWFASSALPFKSKGKILIIKMARELTVKDGLSCTS